MESHAAEMCEARSDQPPAPPENSDHPPKSPRLPPLPPVHPSTFLIPQPPGFFASAPFSDERNQPTSSPSEAAASAPTSADQPLPQAPPQTPQEDTEKMTCISSTSVPVLNNPRPYSSAVAATAATTSTSSGASARAGSFNRGVLPSSMELARRLRGLVMNAAVNFRDVDLMPQLQPLEGDMGLMEAMDQQGEEPDADAATGSAATSVVPTEVVGAVIQSVDGGGGDGGGSGGEAGAQMVEREGGSAGEPPLCGWGGSGGAGSGAGDGPVSGGVERVSAVAGAAAGGSAVSRPGGGSHGGRLRTSGAVVRKNKLVIIMVGLPGRGKTFLCNKLCCYLNWLGHATRHFNVGSYRRLQKTGDELQDAEFFNHTNEAGLEARHRALFAALDDLMCWLRSDVGQVAVFDATNTTSSRRNLLISKFHGQWQYLFIETICSDPTVLEQNYRNKMKYSPDYQGVDTDQAVADFLLRIAKYEEVYDPINDRNLHYIKLIDMVTGRGHMDINRISGYLPGKIVFFLMQICKAGMTSVRKIWLSRHGESEYNKLELIGGNSSLSERGERYSRALPEALISRLPQEQPVSVAVWTSTLKRTIETARFLPFPKLRWKALDEIDAGICDGMTYEQIAEKYPQEYYARKKDKLRYRYPSGESYMDVIQRVEPVIIELERERESVLVVAHQAVLRAVYAYFTNVPPEDIPCLSMPLHTLIELTPMPDGTMKEQRFPVDTDACVDMEADSPHRADVVAPKGVSAGAGGVHNAEEAEQEVKEAARQSAWHAGSGGHPLVLKDLEAGGGGVSSLSSASSGASCLPDAGGSMMLPVSPAHSPRDGGAVDAAMESDGLSSPSTVMCDAVTAQ